MGKYAYLICIFPSRKDVDKNVGKRKHSLAVPQNVEHKITICPAIPLLGMDPKQQKTGAQTHP